MDWPFHNPGCNCIKLRCKHLFSHRAYILQDEEKDAGTIVAGKGGVSSTMVTNNSGGSVVLPETSTLNALLNNSFFYYLVHLLSFQI
jgi:hypothetical protein